MENSSGVKELIITKYSENLNDISPLILGQRSVLNNIFFNLTNENARNECHEILLFSADEINSFGSDSQPCKN